MAAASLATLETVFEHLRDAHRNQTSTMTVTTADAAQQVEKLITDRNALYAACVAVSAVGGEATSKALTDAAIVASDLLVGA